ncbi:hypothetical protein MKW98_007580, partial [Papaver atlanticum]
PVPAKEDDWHKKNNLEFDKMIQSLERQSKANLKLSLQPARYSRTLLSPIP